MKCFLLSSLLACVFACSKNESTNFDSLDNYTGIYSGKYTAQKTNGGRESLSGDTVLVVSKDSKLNCLVLNNSIYFTPSGEILNSSENFKNRSLSKVILVKGKLNIIIHNVGDNQSGILTINLSKN